MSRNPDCHEKQHPSCQQEALVLCRTPVSADVCCDVTSWCDAKPLCDVRFWCDAKSCCDIKSWCDVREFSLVVTAVTRCHVRAKMVSATSNCHITDASVSLGVPSRNSSEIQF